MRSLAIAIVLLVPGLALAGDLVGRPMVMDGDTMRFDGQDVNLFGVHAPMISQSCGGAGEIWSCGWEAAMYLEEQIADHEVTCVEAARTGDGERRARCTARGEDLAGLMIDAGLAVADEEHGAGYLEREAAAAEGARGMWSGPFVDPVLWAEKGGCSCGARKQAMIEAAELLKAAREAGDSASDTASE